MSHATFLEKLLDLSARQAVGRQEDGEVCLSGRQVEWLPLGDLTEYEQPTKYLVKTRNYSDEFSTPVLTAGKTFVLGYTDETDGIYKASGNPVIIFDDFTSANKWVDFDFKAKSSAMKMVTSSDEGKLSLRYLYHWLNTLPSGLIDGDHKRQWISNYSYKKIPIPCPENPERSLAIQAEIVRVLDAFTELTAELTAELAARRKQYNYYRDQLLTFEEGDVEWKTLGEVCDIASGGTPSKKKLEYWSKGDVPWLKSESCNNIPVYSANHFITELGLNKSSAKLFQKGTTLMALVGATIFKTAYLEFESSTNQNMASIKPKEGSSIADKYVFYFLTNIYFELKAKMSNYGMLNLTTLRAFKIPIPFPEDPEKSFAEQSRIVAILDKFDTLTHSISEGLPREIELRQKQYEYYRDLLLNFPKPEPETEGVA